MATIFWTDIAQSNLIEIRTYIALSSLLQADLLIDALLTKVRMPERYPEAGKIIKEVPRSNYRELLFKKYRIIYRVQDDMIYIMTVWHSARLLQNNPLFKDEF